MPNHWHTELFLRGLHAIAWALAQRYPYVYAATTNRYPHELTMLDITRLTNTGSNPFVFCTSKHMVRGDAYVTPSLYEIMDAGRTGTIPSYNARSFHNSTWFTDRERFCEPTACLAERLMTSWRIRSK